MKAKCHIGLFSILLISASSMRAQVSERAYYQNEVTTVVVNNYHGDHDYYFSSRINRFHKSYSTFNYYAPVFTETYWYNYQPYTWGVSIYGGGGFGFAYATAYPVYNTRYYGNWYQPYISNSYYWGYDPYYYNYAYAPAVVNVMTVYNRPVYVNHNHHYNDYYHPANKNNKYSYNYSSKSSPGNSNSGSAGGDTRRYVNPKDRRITDDGNSNNNSNIGNNSNNSNNSNNGNSRSKGTDARTIPNSDKKTGIPANSQGRGGSGTEYSSGRSSSGTNSSGSVSTRSGSSPSNATTSGRSVNTQSRKSSTSESEIKSSGSSSSKEKSTKRR